LLHWVVLSLHSFENILPLVHRFLTLSKQLLYLQSDLVCEHYRASEDHCSHCSYLEVGWEQEVAGFDFIEVGLLTVVVVYEHYQHVDAVYGFAAYVLRLIDEGFAVEDVS